MLTLRRLSIICTTMTVLSALPAQPVLAAHSVVAAGSTALLPLVKGEAQRYAVSHPEIRVSVSGGGSGTGLTEVSIGAVDIGNSDIPAPGVQGIRDHRVAVIGFALIANNDVRVTTLSRQQLADIFSGQKTNWREVGGNDEPIVVINRPRSSGTRKVFQRTLMGASPIADSSLTVDASGTVVSTVSSTPGAISYVALSALRHADVMTIAIDHVRPSQDAITHGQYPLWAYEHMFTAANPDHDVEAFVEAVAADTALLEQLGYISIKSMHVEMRDR
jgi:phosphate transport system substrate-binding protein